MPIDVQKFEQLKARVDKLQREKDRAEGALSQLTERLQTEYDCETVDDAKQKLADLKKKSATKEKSYGQALAVFDKSWSENFKGVDDD